VIKERKDRTAIEIEAGRFWQARHMRRAMLGLYYRKDDERRGHPIDTEALGREEAGGTSNLSPHLFWYGYAEEERRQHLYLFDCLFCVVAPCTQTTGILEKRRRM
jgi:hypothetical protein